MPPRRIRITKSFEKGLRSWREYKISSKEDLKHYTSKLRHIQQEIIRIASLDTYPLKKVTYRNSKNVQYFVYQQHVVFFKLLPKTMKLLYFVAARRVKNKYL